MFRGRNIPLYSIMIYDENVYIFLFMQTNFRLFCFGFAFIVQFNNAIEIININQEYIHKCLQKEKIK